MVIRLTKMKKIITTVFIIIATTTLMMAQITEDISAALKTGNYHEIAKYFSNTIELNIPGNEGAYSKAQAEQILKEFFYKNNSKGHSIIHQGESKEGAKYAMGSLVTTTGTYRTYYHLKKVGESFQIKELRIEGDK